MEEVHRWLLMPLFFAGLARIETTYNGEQQEAWRPGWHVLHYTYRYLEPDFVVDISDVFERKIEAIKAYKTQFHNLDVEGPQTYISTPEFLDSICLSLQDVRKNDRCTICRRIYFRKKMIGLKSLDALIKENT